MDFINSTLRTRCEYQRKERIKEGFVGIFFLLYRESLKREQMFKKGNGGG